MDLDNGSVAFERTPYTLAIVCSFEWLGSDQLMTIVATFVTVTVVPVALPVHVIVICI